MSGFWTWAMAHEILTFFLFLSALKTIRVVFKSVTRIWWAPTLPQRPNDSEDEEDETEEREEGLHIEVAPRPAQVPTAQPARPRRTLWARILDD